MLHAPAAAHVAAAAHASAAAHEQSRLFSCSDFYSILFLCKCVVANMVSDHTYFAKCPRCEICPDCGLDPKIHYKQEEMPKLLTSKFFQVVSSTNIYI